MANTICVLPKHDLHIKTFISGGLTPVPVVEICQTEMADGSYWNTFQLTSKADAVALADAILRAAESLPD